MVFNDPVELKIIFLRLYIHLFNSSMWSPAFPIFDSKKYVRPLYMLYILHVSVLKKVTYLWWLCYCQLDLSHAWNTILKILYLMSYCKMNLTHRYSSQRGLHRSPFVPPAVYDNDEANASRIQTENRASLTCWK